jgi:hypothetical protein
MGSKSDSKVARPKRNKISNRLKRQRSPSPEKEERVPAPRNPRRLKKALEKKQLLADEKAAAKAEAAKKLKEDESMSEGEVDLNKESLSKLKGAFADDDFEGFERMDSSDAESGDDQVQDDEFEGDEQAVEESDEVCIKKI